ncbi:MAG: hypothetical protein R3E97_19495 [Candidatus Eisenbacteria bacterium]
MSYAESPAGETAAQSPDLFLAHLAPTLGNEPASRLGMKFEVTFMKFDVAQLEARLAPTVSALIEPIVRNEARSDEAEEQIATWILDPSAPILLSMEYLRDADYDRFQKGLRISMEQAAASGAITEEEGRELTARLTEESEPLMESGVTKGSVLAHYISGDTVRTVYLEPDGTIRLDVSRDDAILGRALRASWFGEKSRFREKLIRSLFVDR